MRRPLLDKMIKAGRFVIKVGANVGEVLIVIRETVFKISNTTVVIFNNFADFHNSL